MYLGKETKFVVGNATPHIIRAFLIGQGIQGAHYSEVEGFWAGEREQAVELVIGGLSQEGAEKIAVALAVYFTQDYIYMVRNGEILLVSRPEAAHSKPDTESRESWYRGRSGQSIL